MNSTAKELLAEERHNFDSLVKVMELLRAPGGCPWDREQTHESIRANFIEETYEVVEAIDTADAALLREELGDVLLQVVFHARISEEEGAFTIDDVIHDVTHKLIHRHPHIFADVVADTSEQVLTNWEMIKTEEKKRVGLAGSLNSVPPSLPALMRAQKLMKKAGKAGIEADASALAEALSSASARVCDALRSGEYTAAQADIDTLSFLTAAAGQAFSVDVEEHLNRANTRFVDILTKNEQELGDISTLDDVKKKNLAQNAYFSH